MIETSQTETDVTQELCSLLQLRPAEARSGRTAVLTTEPTLWKAFSERILVIDLSMTLGTRSVAAPGRDGFSSSELATKALAFQPEAVIVDFTIPFGLSFPPKFILRDPTSPLTGMVSDDLPEMNEPRIDARQVLLAWAAGIPSVRSLATVTLSSLTTNPADDWLRQYLAARLQLCAVVELPSDLLRPLTSAPTSLLYFGGNRKDAYFDNLASRGDLVDMETRSWFKSLVSWLAGPENHTTTPPLESVTSAILVDRDFVAAPDDDAEPGDREREPPGGPVLQEADTGYVVPREGQVTWSPGSGDAEVAALDARVGRLGPTQSLGDLCDIVVGTAKPRAVAVLDTGIALIESRNLKDGDLDVDGALQVADDHVEGARVQVRDVLVSMRVADRFSVALNRYNGPAILSDSVVAVRSRSDRVSPEYLFEYLSSAMGRKLLAARSGPERVSVEALCTVPVPIVGPDRLRGLAEIQLVERALRDKADELEADRRALFDARNERALAGHLDRLRRRGKLMSASMRSLESLDYQIAVTYPFPVAYGYRLLQASADPRDLYKEQFRMAENLLAFLASICLTVLEPEDRAATGIDRDRGMTIGKWRDIVDRSSRAFAGEVYRDNPLAGSIRGLRIAEDTKGFGASIQEIVEARNQWAHMKDATLLEDIVETTEARQETLRSCMSSLDFLTEYPVRRIEELIRKRSGHWQFDCTCYRGDHPGLPRESVRLGTEPPAGDLNTDLFLDVGHGRWISLYPFITSWTCPRCKWRETYYVDYWNSESREATLKSFERSHLEKRGDVADGLEDWAATDKDGG